MSKRQWLMVFGALIIIRPFIGVPSKFSDIVYSLIGLLIIFIAYTLRPQTNKTPSSDGQSLPYSEHRSDTNTKIEEIKP